MNAKRAPSREFFFAGCHALLFLLGLLHTIQLSGLYFTVMEHRIWFETQLTLGYDLTWIIAVLFMVCMVILLVRRKTASVLPLLGLLLTPVIGFDYALVAASLLASLAGVYVLNIVRDFVSWFLGILGFVSFLSLRYWMVSLPLGLKHSPMDLVYFEQFLYYLVLPLSYLFIAALLLGSLYTPIQLFLGKIFMKVEVIQEKVEIKSVWIFLGLILLLNVYSVIYLTLPTINAGFLDIGTDVAEYVVELGKVDANLSHMFTPQRGSRPFFYLFLRAFQTVFALDAQSTITFSPIVISVLLVLSVFTLTREMLDESHALWASFFTVFGFHFVVGMYAFFLTNMLALALSNMMLALTFRALRTRELILLALVAALGVVLLFTHPWTLAQYMAPFGLLILYMAWRGPSETRTLSRILLAASVASMGLAELLKTRLLSGYGVLDAILDIRKRMVPVEEVTSSILKSFFDYSGLLANPLLLGLATVGLTSKQLKGAPKAYFSLFLFTSTVMFLAVNDALKQRLLYNYPWGILAALGLLRIMETKNDALRRVIPVFVVVCLLVYTYRSLANLF